MSIIFEERPSDSPYLESVTRGRTASAGSSIRPAEINWHMVLRKLNGKTHLLVVGPWSTAGMVTFGEGAELLWIRFKLGTFMPHLPPKMLLNKETTLPGAGDSSFFLKGSGWQFPDFENVETFIERLAREELLARDPVVEAVLQGLAPETASRTVRHRFLRATGLSQSHIHQVERAQRAAALLARGVPILDTTYEAGYFDQPHLTRSLKRLVGRTPAQQLAPFCLPD